MPDTNATDTGSERARLISLGLIAVLIATVVWRLTVYVPVFHDMVVHRLDAKPADGPLRLVSAKLLKAPLAHDDTNYIPFADVLKFVDGTNWLSGKDHLANCVAARDLAPKAALSAPCAKYFAAEPRVELTNPSWVVAAGTRHTFTLAASHPGGIAINRIEIVDVRSGQTVHALSVPSMTVRYENCRAFFGPGCDFKQSLAVDIATNAPTGAYHIRLLHTLVDGTTSERGGVRFFVQTFGDQARSADAVVVIPDWTGNAYNRHGGGSLYGVNDDTFTLAPLATVNKLGRISLARPDSSSKLHSPAIHQAAVTMMQNAGLDVVVCGMRQLHNGTCKLLPSVPVVLIGHNEYVSLESWRQLEQLVDRGGVLINFSGNLAWWKTRYSDGELFVFKGKRSKRPKEGNWRDTGLFVRRLGNRHKDVPPFTPSRLVGVSYRVAGYPVNRIQRDLELSSPLIAGLMQCDHPIFAAIPARRGEHFLRERGVLSGGVEIDGVLIDNNVNITAEHYMPPGSRIRILATSFAQRSNKKPPVEMGFVTEYQRGGTQHGRVISLGSAGAVFQMARSDSELAQILLSTIDYASALITAPKDTWPELEGCIWQTVE